MSDDSTRARRWRALTRRLRPLTLEIAPSIPWARVLAVDTLETKGYGRLARFRVLVTNLNRVWSGAIEVMTYSEPSVRFLRIYSIPGRRERVAVLSFRAIPFEDVYEVQAPVLLDSNRPDTLRVEWKTWHP